MFVVPGAELHGSSSRGSRIVISRSEFSLRCNVRLLFVCSPERGLYIRDREYPCLNKTTFLGFMVFIDRVRLLADRLDRSAIGGIRSDFTQSEVMGLNSEYVPLLFIPLKLVSSVYSLLKPSGKSVSRRRRGV